MREFLLLASLPVVCGVATAQTNPIASTDYLVQSTIIPRFNAVARSASEQAAAWDSFCSDRTPAGAERLRTEFNKVADAWANIEFVRIGPAAVELRAERFNFWLDRRDQAGKALDALLASSDPKSLDPATITGGSVAGQGMPVLERLLYGDDLLARLVAKGPEADRRCAVGTAIAHSLSSLAEVMAADWSRPDGAGAAIAANRKWGFHFADTNQAASVMVTDLLNGLEMLKDFKLPMIDHDLTNENAPRLAEAARSGRSLRNIKLNFAGIHAMLDVFMAAAPAAQKAKLDAAFADTDTKLSEIVAAKKAQSTPREKAALAAAITSSSSLKQIAMDIVPSATGISLGFNNLDGD